MPESDPRPAIHATSTSALRAVAVVLLLAAAVAALPTSSLAAEHDVRGVQYLVLIDSVPTYPTSERRP